MSKSRPSPGRSPDNPEGLSNDSARVRIPDSHASHASHAASFATRGVKGHKRPGSRNPSSPESSLYLTIFGHRVWLPDARGMLVWYGILLVAFSALLVPLKTIWPLLSNLWAFMLVPPFVGALFYTRGTYVWMLVEFQVASVLLVSAFDMMGTGSGPGGTQEGIYTATIYIAAVGIGCEMTYRLTQARKRAERRYRILFERSVAGVFHATPEGMLLDCNSAFAMLLGAKSSREVMGPFGGALRGNYTGAQEWDDLLIFLRENGTISNRERELQRPDGTVLWLLETLTLLPADVSVGVDLGVGAAYSTPETVIAIPDRLPDLRDLPGSKHRQLGRSGGTRGRGLGRGLGTKSIPVPWATVGPMHGPRQGQGRGQLVEGTVIDITERKSAQEALRRLAITDKLTGADNRGEMERLLEIGIAEAEDSGKPLALILFDIDYFKLVNDTYGHDTGDDVLKGVVATVAGELREGDQLARYGGEEFAIMLPDTPGEGALVVAERLRQAVASRVFFERKATRRGSLPELPRRQLRVTVSVGVSQWRGDGHGDGHGGHGGGRGARDAAEVQTNGPKAGGHETENNDPVGKGDSVEALLKRADRALYRAKEAGRNQVQLWHTGPLDALTSDTSCASDRPVAKILTESYNVPDNCTFVPLQGAR